MPGFPPQHVLARRALVEEFTGAKPGWLHRGIAILGITALGVGAAGTVVLAGATPMTVANGPQARVQISLAPDAAKPAAFTRRDQEASRASSRPSLAPTRVRELAQQRAADLSAADQIVKKAAQSKAVQVREKRLAAQAAAVSKKAASLRAQRAKTAAGSSGGASQANQASLAGRTSGAALPLASYTIAARFGAVGSWSRYHTGFDFSAPVGTPIRTPAAGVVTTAAQGPASGWAGTYVTVRHPDGTSSLYAHMSTASVSVGQTVSAGDVVGAVGMTGRTFGPHLHFEVYPAGVEPGDVYRTINPEPWLRALGLRP